MRTSPSSSGPPTRAPLFVSAIAIASAVAIGAVACKRSAPEPSGTADAAPSIARVQGPDVPNRPQGRNLERDDAGHLLPRTEPPPLTSAERVPTPGREPDWDIDSSDPARDYVNRYILATKRYADKTGCVRASAPRSDGNRTLVDAVEVKDDPCKLGGAVLDTFAVRAGDDRLELANPKKGAPLAKWPDGSAPDAPPSGKVLGEDDIHKWNAPIHEYLVKMRFTPIRVQYYGRGSYPVITLAGWREPLQPGSSAESMAGIAKGICDATKGAPVGLFGGVNRADILRVRCPDKARWERL